MRHQIQTWLDDRKPLERDLVGFIAELKQQRSFAQTIRNGLRLIRDLRQGKVEVLEALFPFIKEYYSRTTPPAPAATDPDTEKRLTILEQLTLLNATSESRVAHPAQLPLSTGNLMKDKQPHEAKTTADLIEVTNATHDSRSGWNTLISMAALSGHFEDLPAEVWAYGVQIGRIPARRKPSTQKRAKSPQNAPKQASVGSPKSLSGFKVVETPSFDDLVLEI